jgi:hypothetical protein
LKNQLAAKVTGFAYLVRGHGFAELKASISRGRTAPSATSATMCSNAIDYRSGMMAIGDDLLQCQS